MRCSIFRHDHQWKAQSQTLKFLLCHFYSPLVGFFWFVPGIIEFDEGVPRLWRAWVSGTEFEVGAFVGTTSIRGDDAHKERAFLTLYSALSGRKVSFRSRCRADGCYDGRLRFLSIGRLILSLTTEDLTNFLWVLPVTFIWTNLSSSCAFRSDIGGRGCAPHLPVLQRWDLSFAGSSETAKNENRECTLVQTIMSRQLIIVHGCEYAGHQ